MTDEPARGQVDRMELFVDDTVLVRGTVVRSVDGVGALVRFTSKTEDYQGWICEEDLWSSLSGSQELPPEPADGTWLMVHNDQGMCRIFHRDDAEGHCDRPTRRHDRHWWDVVAEQWIDWPEAVVRGAAHTGVQRMRVESEDE